MNQPLTGLLGRLGLKPILSIGVDAAKVSLGIAEYLVRGSTPEYAYQAMVELYCLTGGRSNDVLSRAISSLRPRHRLPPAEGVLGRLDDHAIQEVVEDVRRRGYHIFAQKLPPAICDQLAEIATSRPCRVRPLDSSPGAKEVVARYDSQRPIGVRYDVQQSDLINHATVQELISDYSILNVAQEYLGAAPILDIVTMWWHTAFSKDPQKTAAQYYHFDMDRLKWIKFFVLLTDVSTDTGPHCYIAGSHRSGGTPRALLRHGYSRLGDEQVRPHFADDDFIELTGPRGTIVAEDTRGLHKGKHVDRGHRLMFEIEFTNSLFGGALPDDRIVETHSPRLAQLIEEHRPIYKLFV